MTLRTRLVLSLAAIALVLALPALYALRQLDSVTDIARGQQLRHGVAFRALGSMQRNLAQLDQLQRSQLIEPDIGKLSQISEHYARLRIQADTLGSAGFAPAADLAEARVDSLASLSRSLDSIFQVDRNRTAEAHAELFVPVLNATVSSMDSIAESMVDASDANFREAMRLAGEAAASTVLALAVALAIAVVLGGFTTRLVTGPILRLREAMAGVAAGRFEVPESLPYDRQDELGDVSRSFRTMTEQLADLERLKAEFMSIATHELKTPINVIAGYAELMEDRIFGDLSQKQEEALLSITEQTRVLTQLVNQLLDMSRLEAGGLRLETDTVVVVDLVERVRRTFSVLADRKSIRFSATVEPGAPATLHADADRLRDQVLGNLLSNALKFTPDEGEISVVFRGEKKEAVISVSDSGAGIPADKLPHIFDKYYQVSGEGRSKGAGLGLTIAHDVVEAHGGTISAESKEGEGTTFIIRLPLDGHPEAALHKRTSPAAVDGLGAGNGERGGTVQGS